MNADRNFSERLNRSLFFLVAVLLHLVVFLMVVGYVVFPTKPAPSDDSFVRTAIIPVPPAPPKAPVNDQGPPLPGAPVSPIHSDDSAPGSPAVHLDPADLMNGIVPGAGVALAHDPAVRMPDNAPLKPASPVDLQHYKAILESYDPQHTGHLKFPIYLAKYADGDWSCNDYFHGDQLTSGCLPNLLAKVREWSHGELESPEIKAVALDSPELIENPPPFVFFTGHKDFHLTAAEIVNLRKYLQNGGAIWGDSAFAGDGSRFDVAFHREMKLVLPDKDLPFQPLPADHEIFTKSRFRIEELPPGMNRRDDPIECINLGGKLAILYTPNDYSDLMTMDLQPGLDESSAQLVPYHRWTAQDPLYTPGNFLYHAGTYYRNYEPAAAMRSFKLSMNILVHLLHRYDEELLLTP
jgi:hypothetical protein